MSAYGTNKLTVVAANALNYNVENMQNGGRNSNSKLGNTQRTKMSSHAALMADAKNPTKTTDMTKDNLHV